MSEHRPLTTKLTEAQRLRLLHERIFLLEPPELDDAIVGVFDEDGRMRIVYDLERVIEILVVVLSQTPHPPCPLPGNVWDVATHRASDIAYTYSCSASGPVLWAQLSPEVAANWADPSQVRTLDGRKWVETRGAL